jgi:UDP-N-acetylmuramoyl-tripeptide--D-alanyl-D-alanine ligase
MEELGESAGDWHRTVGREWPKGVQDCFVLVGDQGDDLCRGLLESGHDPLTITVNPSPGKLASVVENWTGAVFIKGSRRHRLEEQIGSAWRQAVEAEAAC